MIADLDGLAPGDVLVPRETPVGPADARAAWAQELRQLLVVVSLPAPGLVVVNVPSRGETVRRSVADVVAEYESPDDVGEFGRSWAASVTRAAQEAARVDEAEFGGRGAARYWERVAAVVGRVFREEEGR